MTDTPTDDDDWAHEPHTLSDGELLDRYHELMREFFKTGALYRPESDEFRAIQTELVSRVAIEVLDTADTAEGADDHD